MEYVYLIGLVIAIVVWIVKGIYRFFKWVAASISGTSPAPAVPAPLPPRTATAPAPAPVPPTARDTRRPPLPASEAQTRAVESTPLSGLAETPPPTTAPLTASGLFSSTDDLVRAFILREVLGTPLSRRRTPQK